MPGPFKQDVAECLADADYDLFLAIIITAASASPLHQSEDVFCDNIRLHVHRIRGFYMDETRVDEI